MFCNDFNFRFLIKTLLHHTKINVQLSGIFSSMYNYDFSEVSRICDKPSLRVCNRDIGHLELANELTLGVRMDEFVSNLYAKFLVYFVLMSYKISTMLSHFIIKTLLFFNWPIM